MSQDAFKEPVKILVVDDDQTNAELLEAKLSALGYEVTTANTAEEGIAVDAKLRPHLILLDVVLPEMSGFEACRKLIESHKDRYVPIILVTGMHDVSAKISGLESGAYGYITKPYDAQELLARVRSALRTKHLYDELMATREKLTEAEKLAALGQMAITLHHELNNPLQAIVLLAENLLNNIETGDISREDVQGIIDGCARIQDVLKKIVSLKRVRSAQYVGDADMLDLDGST
jgi:DNA-binding response OmpR family regulator